MYDYRTKYGSEYANGMNELYPPFWEVQYIYIPIYVQAIEDWLLVQINLCTMELTQYWCNHKYSKHYRRLIHNGVLQKFDMFFDKLLDAVSYWRRVIHGPYKPQEKGYLKTGLINDDYLPKIGGALGKDSGVFLCMLMYKLVHKKAFTMEGGGFSGRKTGGYTGSIGLSSVVDNGGLLGIENGFPTLAIFGLLSYSKVENEDGDATHFNRL
ncbi:hypothetical protein R6Q57_010149 [Mikania cordata]